MRNDKRDDLSIEVLNRLDEKIVEKNLNRRFELLQKLKEKTKRILTRKQKAWIFGGGGAAAAVLLAFLGIFLFGIFAKQVPIYTGMTVSRAPQTVASGYDWDQHVYLDASGDLVTTESTTALTEAVEEAVKDSLQVEGATEKMYYANRGEEIYITVHIDNPDSYEILSFTLNGQKYTSYMFEQGSDLENLILKVNVGQDEGVVEYTIDAIKYVDGTEIKDVKMDGERTVRVGIYTEDQPTAAIGKMHVGLDYLKLNVTVEDKKLLIERSLGAAAVVLYDGVGLPKFEIVPVGETTEVTIEGLTRNTEYELAVVFAYDDLSGSGFAFHTPLKQTVRTQNYLSFEEVSTTQTAVSFAVEWFEEFENKEIVALSLYRNGEKVRDLPPEALAADGLLCNNVYTLVATVQADGEYETVEVSFRTKAKTAPTVSVTESAKTQTSLDFAVQITDPDAIASITKIELLHGNDAPIVASSINIRSFADLLSNNDYTVRVTYAYDLNDGNGVHTESKTVTVHTMPKVAPTVSVTETDKTQTSLDFAVRITDPDAIASITKIELLHGNNAPIVASNINIRSFADLLSNNDYTVKVTYAYDLNDGNGVHTESKTVTVHTMPKVAPTVVVTDAAKTTASLDFAINVTDPDNLYRTVKIELLDKNGAVVKTAENLLVRSFGGLAEYTKYSIRVTYAYDLNDGDGVHTETSVLDTFTAPHYALAGVECLNTTAIKIGDRIVLKIQMDLSSGLVVKKATVNGNQYDVSTVGTSYIAINIPVTETLGGGSTQLVIEKLMIEGCYRSEAYYAEPAANHTVNVFINGNLDITVSIQDTTNATL